MNYWYIPIILLMSTLQGRWGFKNNACKNHEPTDLTKLLTSYLVFFKVGHISCWYILIILIINVCLTKAYVALR